MSSHPIRIKYVGTALPGNGATVTLFSTVDAGWAANGFALLGIARLIFSINNDQSGTLKAYQSTDRGVTWVQAVADDAESASGATAENINDYLVEQYADWKLDWVNGATPQTRFTVNIAADSMRNVAN